MTKTRPNEFEYASHVSYARALEEYCSSLEKREFIGLTDEDMDFLFPHGSSVWVQETVKIIEAKLKEKNQ